MADVLVIALLAGALGWLSHRDELAKRSEEAAWEDLRAQLEHDGVGREPGGVAEGDRDA